MYKNDNGHILCIQMDADCRERHIVIAQDYSVKAIRLLLEFIIEWEEYANGQNFKFLSDSTCYGLKVTLKATLEMMLFLSDVCGYNHLMTSRLNKDSLERFFRVMRNATGSNDHLDSETFLQLYRLLSTYSLIKPPKGSCTSGTEILNTLLSIKDVQEEESETKVKWSTFLDNIIDEGTADDLMLAALEMIEDHSYDMLNSSDFIISYVSGYVIRRASKFSNCEMCLQTLTTPDANKFIQLKSRGSLLYPSPLVINLITGLESNILSTIRKSKVHTDLLYDVMEKISQGQNINLLGCNEHKYQVTEKIVQFYMIIRFHFICRQFNKNENSNKTKKLRKYSKM